MQCLSPSPLNTELQWDGNTQFPLEKNIKKFWDNELRIPAAGLQKSAPVSKKEIPAPQPKSRWEIQNTKKHFDLGYDNIAKSVMKWDTKSDHNESLQLLPISKGLEVPMRKRSNSKTETKTSTEEIDAPCDTKSSYHIHELNDSRVMQILLLQNDKPKRTHAALHHPLIGSKPPIDTIANHTNQTHCVNCSICPLPASPNSRRAHPHGECATGGPTQLCFNEGVQSETTLSGGEIPPTVRDDAHILSPRSKLLYSNFHILPYQAALRELPPHVKALNPLRINVDVLQTPLSPSRSRPPPADHFMSGLIPTQQCPEAFGIRKQLPESQLEIDLAPDNIPMRTLPKKSRQQSVPSLFESHLGIDVVPYGIGCSRPTLKLSSDSLKPGAQWPDDVAACSPKHSKKHSESYLGDQFSLEESREYNNLTELERRLEAELQLHTSS